MLFWGCFDAVSVLTMMDWIRATALLTTHGSRCATSVAICIQNDDFCIKNDEFCITNDELCITNDEFCIKNDEFCIKNDELCITNDEFCIKNDDSNANFQATASSSWKPTRRRWGRLLRPASASTQDAGSTPLTTMRTMRYACSMSALYMHAGA